MSQEIADYSSSRNKRLAIVPAYNESESIAGVVSELRRELPDFDILVIDDGSTDSTARRVPADATVLSLPFNLGIGGAMQTGYRYAALHGYELAVQVDGDGQHPPHEVRKLVLRLEQGDVDLVIGSRFLENNYRQNPARMGGIFVLRWLIRFLSGQSLTDPTSGFRAANRSVIRAFAYWYPDDYPEPEIALLLHRSGYRVVEIPTVMRQRTTGQSSIPLLRGFFYVAKVSIALLLDTIRDPWPRDKVKPI